MTELISKPLMSLDDVLAQMLAQVTQLASTERLALLDADARVLANDVVSDLQVPPQDNSSMDGYAVRSDDILKPGQTLKVTQRIPAGSVGTALGVGEAARIFTGANLPPGANAVVMQEDVSVSIQQTSEITVNVPVLAGQWVRKSGEDVKRASVVLRAGTRLGPADVGLAASIGMDSVLVVQRPKVALFSTGDELVMPGSVAPADMRPGAIYNSNRFFLSSLLKRLGCEVTDLGIVPDQRNATEEALQKAANHHDLILTSGGVSVGEEDHVKPAVQSLGALNLWQVAMKPGKPLAFGWLHSASDNVELGRKVFFIGLPGNPVSGFVTFLLLVRPFIGAMQGVRERLSPFYLPVNFDWPKADKRREFLRVRRNSLGSLDVFPNQSSGVLTSVVWADGLLDVAANQSFSKGELMPYWPFGGYAL